MPRILVDMDQKIRPAQQKILFSVFSSIASVKIPAYFGTNSEIYKYAIDEFATVFRLFVLYTTV